MTPRVASPSKPPTTNHQPTTNYRLFHPVVRRFLGNRHIMHVALARARRRNANQLRFPLQLHDRWRTAVAHTSAQAADELMNHRRDAPLVRDAPLDSLGHQLVRGSSAFEIEFVLEVAVAAAAPHRADRSHAAVLLVAAALDENQLARTFVGPREQIAAHPA